jgi:hypothetical protein
MSLVQCAACSTQVSNEASRCPQCGHPTKKPSRLKRELISMGIVLASGFLIYQFALSPRTKQGLSLAVAPLGLPIVPWADRAEAVVREICRKSGDQVAQSVLSATHPTGKEASLSSISFSKDNQGLICTLNISWYGAILHTHYLTTVAWHFGEQGHIGATLVHDSSQIGASPGTAAGLEQYFGTELWPAVAKLMGQSTTT